MALITAAYIRALPLGLPENVLGGVAPKIAEATLTEMIDVASTKVEDYCRRKFSSVTVVEQKRGKNSRRMMLRHFPVVSLDSITWVNDFGTTGTVDVANIRTFLNTGIIETKTTLVYPFYADYLYTITYTAGYATVPGPVKMATAIWTLLLLQPVLAPGRGKAESLIENGMEQVVELLEDYRREVMG